MKWTAVKRPLRRGQAISPPLLPAARKSRKESGEGWLSKPLLVCPEDKYWPGDLVSSNHKSSQLQGKDRQCSRTHSLEMPEVGICDERARGTQIAVEVNIQHRQTLSRRDGC